MTHGFDFDRMRLLARLAAAAWPHLPVAVRVAEEETTVQILSHGRILLEYSDVDRLEAALAALAGPLACEVVAKEIWDVAWECLTAWRVRADALRSAIESHGDAVMQGALDELTRCAADLRSALLEAGGALVGN